ncbi:MAG: A24 family peptidase [Anaerolineae bacterium]|jgi:prepilin signal peptidase PulO-like enzyme (type II secretory pathway)|nr:A24 family peptidase [Anaerolineae bacterium]
MSELNLLGAASFGLVVLLGWLAGGIGNWAADVLPRRPAPAPAGGDGRVFWHYLTLFWRPFRHGICPHCGEPRPLRAPLLELATMAAFALVWWRFGATPVRAGVTCLYAAFLLTVAVIDLEHRRVLNVMLAPAALVALFASLLPGPPSVLSAVLGGAAGFGFFFLIALIGRGKMGAGDVKLAGVIGLMLGFPAAITALVIGIFLGGAAAIILLITHRAGRKSTFAYAPYLVLGALVMLLMR